MGLLKKYPNLIKQRGVIDSGKRRLLTFLLFCRIEKILAQKDFVSFRSERGSGNDDADDDDRVRKARLSEGRKRK